MPGRFVRHNGEPDKHALSIEEAVIMEFRGLRGQILRAALCEIERGLFLVTYSSDRQDRDVSDLPTYQVAKSALEAQLRIEERAYICGFVNVVWDPAPPAPTGLPDRLSGISPPGGVATDC
jgi:hypothetical protein